MKKQIEYPLADWICSMCHGNEDYEECRAKQALNQCELWKDD